MMSAELNEAGAVVKPAGLSGLGQNLEFVVRRNVAALKTVYAALADFIPHVRVNQHVRMECEQFLAAVTCNLLDGRVGIKKFLRAENEKSGARSFSHGAKLGFALLQRLLGPPALSHIAAAHYQAGDLSTFFQPVAQNLEWTPLTVTAPQPHLHRTRIAGPVQTIVEGGPSLL